jgi:hypothetical protein
MVFLNPLFLWFGLAIAVPILVHLFNFRRPKLVLFSHVAFVREVNKSVVRRVKLKQWLLLLLRILAILALVLAFANPIIPVASVGGLKTGANSVVIIMDNTLSMSAADSKGVLLQQAKRMAEEIVKNYSPTDEFQIQLLGNTRNSLPFSTRKQALEQIPLADFQYKVVSLAQLATNANAYFSQARNANRVLYFISDYQKATILRDSLPNNAMPDQIEFNCIPIGTQERTNAYVSNLQLEQSIFEKDKPVTMNLRINNDGEKALENVSIKVHLESKIVAIASVNIGPLESKEIPVSFTPSKSGWQNGYVAIDDMPVDFDNQRFFSFHIPEDTKILVVNGPKPSKYLDLLFSQLVKQYKVVTVNEKNLPSVDLNEYSTLVLAGPSDLSAGLSEKISNWVKVGGGLMFFPQSDMNVAAINAFYQSCGIGQFGTVLNYKPMGKFTTPDLSHILFQSVFTKPKPNAEFDSPVVSKLYDFIPAPGAIQSTIVREAQGKPILQETKVGSGTVLTFSLFPSLDWSDFPIKSSFVPILYRGILLLNNAEQQSLVKRWANTCQPSSKYPIKPLSSSEKRTWTLVQKWN